jgi:L-seryl-tRNA(Ser) seleniumtransferase
VSKKSLSAIPGVDTVLDALDDIDCPRPLLLAIVREHLSALRKARSIPAFEQIAGDIRDRVAAFVRARLQPVINATGVIIHTNLGRAPMSAEAVAAVAAVGGGYSNLELDLDSGKRGGRSAAVKRKLALLCGAESATVVNNNAAALILILRHFCTAARPEVIVSRGELVQIGGGFRIPDILESSGAVLREVGTTNRTDAADYEAVIGERTAMILKVHRSNFFMDGFVASPATGELAAIAKKKRVPLVEDLGSGAMVATDQLAAVEHEPTPGDALKRGVQLVCFSGDKLFGGPQAGVIAGRKRLVSSLEKEPLYRALRCDKLILAALEATADTYLRSLQTGGLPELPVVRMMSQSVAELEARANKLIAALAGLPVAGRCVEVNSRLGGGAMPRAAIPSVAVELVPASRTPAELAAALRLVCPPVIGYVSGKSFRLDLRTVFPGQDELLSSMLQSVIANSGSVP